MCLPDNLADSAICGGLVPGSALSYLRGEAQAIFHRKCAGTLAQCFASLHNPATGPRQENAVGQETRSDVQKWHIMKTSD